MESPKVINKVLLSSVAFGVSFGIGMLVSENKIKNALTTGALAATAGFAGTLVSDAKHREAERKKADGENLVEDSLPTGVHELKSQEDGLHQSIAEATMRMQEVETGINSLQTEHAQLLENISDLNSQKQQLETQKEAIETSIAVQQTELEQISDRVAQAQQQQEELDAYLARLESRKQEIETENQNLQAQIHELEQQHAQLAQIIAPLEELKDIDEPSETSWNELTVTEAESIENDNSVGEVEEIFSEELSNLSEEETVSIAVELTEEESIPVENLMDPIEEIASEPEQLTSIDEEEMASLTELELSAEDSEQFEDLFAENPLADGDSSLEELVQVESGTEDLVLLADGDSSLWAELDNSEQEDATIVFTPSESMAEDSEELDNLLQSTTTFDSESLENLMDETGELGILDLVGELAQPESLTSTTEESVTLESLMNEAEIASPDELQEAQTELTNELDDDFFSSISEATEGESTDREQEPEQLDFFSSSSYTLEPNELETASAESEFLGNLIDRTEENFLENFESEEKLPETEIHESSTIDHFLTESLDLEGSFDRWEETSEEFGQLDDLSTSMSESSMEEELEIVDEKLCELDSISEASLEEFEDLLESMEEQNISMSFSDDVDDIETTKTQNLWD
jgi:myosin heavy subunit